jgi:hypothetical protein
MFIKKIQRRIKGGSFFLKTQRKIKRGSPHCSKDHRTRLVSSHMHVCWCNIVLMSSHTKEDQRKIWCLPTYTHVTVFLHYIGVFPHVASRALLLLPHVLLLFCSMHCCCCSTHYCCYSVHYCCCSSFETTQSYNTIPTRDAFRTKSQRKTIRGF